MPSPRVLIPAVLVLCLGLWLFNRSKKAPHPTESVSREERSATQIISTEAKPEASVPKESSEIAASKKRLGQEVALGLKRIPAEVRDSKLFFSLRTKTDGSGCQVGDFDQIKSLAKTADERIFLLSLEPMPGSDGSVQKYPMNVAEITNGARYDVQLNTSRDVAYYGAFLCSIDKKISSCGDKPSMTRKDWQLTAHGKRVLGKGIHFQMLAVRGQELFLLPSNKWDKESLKKLQKILEGSDGSLNAAFMKMRSLLDQLSSLAATISGKTLELNLPYRGSRCD